MEFIYCAFCKHGRKAYTKKHLKLRDMLYCFVLAVLLMLAIWQAYHPALFVAFAFFLIIGESVIHLRRRVSIQCTLCGFDPVLYVKAPKLAGCKVKKVLAEKKSSGKYLFASKNPFEHLQGKINKPPRQPNQ